MRRLSLRTPSLPPEAPLAMPEQAFYGPSPVTIEQLARPPGLFVRRLLLICATAVLGMAASTSIRSTRTATR